jgi:uncharacterized membrane protein (GlpM family)
MSDWLTIALRALAGGLLVVAFALLSEGVKPKRFAGLFSAAPAIAIASLTVTLSTTTSDEAQDGSLGMLAGSAGMLAYAVVVVALLDRVRALAASAAALVAWFAITAIAAAPLLL